VERSGVSGNQWIQNIFRDIAELHSTRPRFGKARAFGLWPGQAKPRCAFSFTPEGQGADRLVRHGKEAAPQLDLALEYN
jgi:hypothetical protein